MIASPKYIHISVQAKSSNMASLSLRSAEKNESRILLFDC